MPSNRSMVIGKIVAIAVAVVVVTQLISSSHATLADSGLQDQQKQAVAQLVPPLGFESPLLIEFIGLDEEQIEKIQACCEQWKTEYEKLASEKASRRSKTESLVKHRKNCSLVLNETQRALLSRYNELTEFRPEEFQVLALSVDYKDPVFEAAQRSQFQEIERTWLAWMDEQCKLRNIQLGEDVDQQNRQASSKELRKLQQSSRQKIKQELLEVFSDPQQKRFSELVLQNAVSSRGVLAFAEPEVAGELNYTPAQQAALRKIVDSLEKETIQQFAVQIQFDSYKTFFDSLSDEQKTVWREKIGGPFPLKNWLRDFIEAEQAGTGKPD